MKILQLNVTSLEISHNELTFYQQQNGYDIIALQETNVKYKLNMFKNWKRKLHSTFTEKKKKKFGVVTLIAKDIKSLFVNNM